MEKKLTGIVGLDILQRKAPNKGVTFIAVDKLSKIGDIVRFIDDYTAYIRNQGFDNPREVAKTGIMAALWEAYDKDMTKIALDPKARNWMLVISEIDPSKYTQL